MEPLADESQSHFRVCDCVRVCMYKCHRLNLHGDDVPFSQAPARIRGGGGRREFAGGGDSVSQSSRGKKSIKMAALRSPGVGVLKRIRLPKILQLHLPFGITRGAASLGETGVTMATYADGDELVHLC